MSETAEQDGTAYAPARGERLPWERVPARIREAVEAHLGSPVAAAATQPGGFSPGAAVRLRLEDGRRAFAKAVGPELNPDSPDIYRSEARIAAALPASAPAPRLLASFDLDGWVALLFEDVEGHEPADPWEPGELDRVLDALAGLAESLTPSPVDAPTIGERMGGEFRGWRRLVAARDAGEDDLAGLDPWARDHLDELAARESLWAEAAAGDTLAHCDVRGDNILLTPDRVVFVDWPWAALAAPWADLLLMLPSVAMQGGPAPAPVFDSHPVARGADPGSVTTVLTAMAGFLVRQSRQPAPPGLSTVRAFQAAQGVHALRWLRERW
ncbi:phosphotransferase [Bailinhaonella thermotolerans]|uniref:Aminoglycoside phosphotransferase family protein n=1 Tax=Bailinhaonella thermotolerans TaxID=1070861 RepID=A0A3A4AZ07_9ACTN|nr:phosphotransferase [Bailinhaonella thermotolerans]RJL32746.1 aminoglycoside phosphotransferase family protein [Bailinhaonella thermotolerans]